MLEHYHWGAYGSKTTGQWSCCSENRKDAPGCRSVTTSPRKDSDVSQTSTQSDDALKSDVDSLTSSIRYSSSCSSGISNYSLYVILKIRRMHNIKCNSYRMEPNCLSPKSHWEPVNFDDRVTHVRRSRAGNGYILLNHNLRLYYIELICILS